MSDNSHRSNTIWASIILVAFIAVIAMDVLGISSPMAVGGILVVASLLLAAK